MEELHHLIAVEQFIADRMFLCNFCCDMVLKKMNAVLFVFEDKAISDADGRGLKFMKVCEKCGIADDV